MSLCRLLSSVCYCCSECFVVWKYWSLVHMFPKSLIRINKCCSNSFLPMIVVTSSVDEISLCNLDSIDVTGDGVFYQQWGCKFLYVIPSIYWSNMVTEHDG